MINSVGTTPVVQNDNKQNIHKRLVSDTGYAAVGFGTVCGVTGLKSVKFNNKIKVHKCSALLAAISAALHFGFTKGLGSFINHNINS